MQAYKPAGGPRSGPGGRGPPWLDFFGDIYHNELEGGSDVVDCCCSWNWLLHDEKTNFSIYVLFFIFFFIFAFGLLTLFWNGNLKNTIKWRFLYNSNLLRIFFKEISICISTRRFSFPREINQRMKKTTMKKDLEVVEGTFCLANTCWWR